MSVSNFYFRIGHQIILKMTKKIILTFFLGIFLLYPVKGQKEVKLTEENSFSMIILPDPQSYIKFQKNQGIFDIVTGWVASNINPLSIRAVLCTGDLVEQNDLLIPDGKNGDQPSSRQWEYVSRSFSRLDNRVPYMISTGNHDYGYVSAENRFTRFNDHFKPDRNNCWEKTLVSVCNNAFGRPTLENAAYEIITDTWGKLMIICAEFAPRDEVLQWAGELSQKYKDHRIIFLTHSYMEYEGSVIEKENYKVTPANYGKTIWEKLIYPSKNIKMVICGHSATGKGDFPSNVAFRTDRNEEGKNIPQMMFNAQTAGGGWHGNGGDGWIRIMEFLPDGKTIRIKTFSPFFAASPTTEQFAWRTDSFDQFDIILE